MGGFKTGKLIYFVLASVSAMHPNRVGDGDGWYGDLHPEIKPSPDPNDVPLTKEAIRDEFKQIDTGGDGKISFDELKEVFKTLNKGATDQELRDMIGGGQVEGLFTARGGAIDFETFKQLFVRCRHRRPMRTRAPYPAASR